MSRIRLDGSVVAITGAARGIGLATAKAFAAEGARVFLGDLDGHLAERAAADLGGQGYALDVRSSESFARFLSAATSVDGRIDVLVNNAGIMPAGRFVDEDDAITDAMVEVNLCGVLRGSKLALPGMLDRDSGHIVNIASYAGRLPIAGLATYCATKYAVIGFSESLRDELAGTGVTVTAVLPSAVRTELTSGIQLGGVLPTVDPEDIAAAVVDSCRNRPGIVAVPPWMRSYEAVSAIVPDGLVGAVRGRLTRSRVFDRLDAQSRAAYEARVRRAAHRADG